MGVLCKDFLFSAKEQFKTEAEINYRNAASRAYYAALHACKIITDDQPDYSDINGTHNRVINQLENYPIKSGTKEVDLSIRALGYTLRQFKLVRNRADYYLDDPFIKLDAESSIKTSEKILNKVSELTKNAVA